MSFRQAWKVELPVGYCTNTMYSAPYETIHDSQPLRLSMKHCLKNCRRQSRYLRPVDSVSQQNCTARTHRAAAASASSSRFGSRPTSIWSFCTFTQLHWDDKFLSRRIRFFLISNILISARNYRRRLTCQQLQFGNSFNQYLLKRIGFTAVRATNRRFCIRRSGNPDETLATKTIANDDGFGLCFLPCPCCN